MRQIHNYLIFIMEIFRPEMKRFVYKALVQYLIKILSYQYRIPLYGDKSA